MENGKSKSSGTMENKKYRYVFAFDHSHKVGDVCSRAHCAAARRAPVLSGSEVFNDIPMLIFGEATVDQYLNQPLPEGWCLPPPVYGCKLFYEVEYQEPAGDAAAATAAPNKEAQNS